MVNGRFIMLVEFKFTGSKPVALPGIISALQARQLLGNGCQRYLASVTDNRSEKVTL